MDSQTLVAVTPYRHRHLPPPCARHGFLHSFFCSLFIYSDLFELDVYGASCLLSCSSLLSHFCQLSLCTLQCQLTRVQQPVKVTCLQAQVSYSPRQLTVGPVGRLEASSQCVLCMSHLAQLEVVKLYHTGQWRIPNLKNQLETWKRIENQKKITCPTVYPGLDRQGLYRFAMMQWAIMYHMWNHQDDRQLDRPLQALLC